MTSMFLLIRLRLSASSSGVVCVSYLLKIQTHPSSRVYTKHIKTQLFALLSYFSNSCPRFQSLFCNRLAFSAFNFIMFGPNFMASRHPSRYIHTYPRLLCRGLCLFYGIKCTYSQSNVLVNHYRSFN